MKISPLLIFLFASSIFLISCNRRTSSPSRTDQTAQAIVSPKQVYESHCASCHGTQGDGNGPAAVWLFPKPRNFSSGLFKIQSTPAGSLPSDEDLFQTVTKGMPGSSMPSFTYLTEAERRAAVEYVKQLAAYDDGSGKKINHFEEAKAKNPNILPIEVPPEPPVTLEALNQGKELFTKLACASCHGQTGAGDGFSAATLKDNWGLPLPPRDFNTGAFRGGHTGRDLYLRIANGMAGTPMPAFDDKTLTKDERWALVLYIQSLRRKEVEINDILAPENGIILAQKIKRALPSDPSDSYWETMDPTRVPLNPLWSWGVTSPIPAVAVRAVHDGKKISILLTWRDPSSNQSPVRVQDFQDAVAIQFPLNGTIPFLGMGDAKNPVNIWQWKAGWQQEAEGSRPDMNTTYASMHTDMYPETKPLFRSAEAAGNLLAQPIHSSPIEDANAKGFGTLKSQKFQEQNVKGKGVWKDGHWSVLFIRDIRSKNTEDVQMETGKSVHTAFAVWDGEQRDRNGRKVISNWYQLQLEP